MKKILLVILIAASTVGLNAQETEVKEAAVDAKETAVDAKETAVDAKDAAVDAKDAAVDAKAEAVEAKAEAVEAKAEAVEAKAEAVEAKAEAVEATKAVEVEVEEVEEPREEVAKETATDVQDEKPEVKNKFDKKWVEFYKWSIAAGWDFIDFRTPSKEIGDFASDYIGTSDLNYLVYPSRLTIERKLSKNFGIQLGGAINKITKPYGYKKGDRETDLSFWNADLKLNYNPLGAKGFFDPFLNIGVGYSSMEMPNNTFGRKVENQANFKVNGGYGANLWITNSFGIKLESSYNHSFSDKGTDFFQHMAGFTYRFAPKYKDTDKDGVIDRDDHCPTVAGVKELNGCPDSDKDGIRDSEDDCPDAPGSKEMNGCPDNDGDSVRDKDDNCPDVAGPKENNGCPWPDTDKDGITDNIDKCPEVAGIEANNGCPEVKEVVVDPCDAIKAEINTNEIYFDLNKSTIKTEGKAKLDRIVEILKSTECKIEVILLNGYADPSGGERYNKGLSKRRAKRVHSYLKRKGVTNITFQPEGFGETNSREENRYNRRVEVRVN